MTGSQITVMISTLSNFPIYNLSPHQNSCEGFQIAQEDSTETFCGMGMEMRKKIHPMKLIKATANGELGIRWKEIGSFCKNVGTGEYQIKEDISLGYLPSSRIWGANRIFRRCLVGYKLLSHSQIVSSIQLVEQKQLATLY